MEDPESEWAIQEYSPPKEDETTMVKWILNKGYVIGKKMVITGIAITSAPLVLPPLAVFSAMGVAFSVPFGLVVASYVCTNTLMNKLLPYPPTPTAPLLLEYYTDEDEEGVDSKFDSDVGGDGYRQTDVGLLYTNEYEDEDEDDEVRKENVKQEEEEERTWETEEGTESSNGYAEEVEALKAGNLDEKGYSTDDEEKEGEDDEIILKSVVQVEYDDLMEANLEENEDEKEREDQDDVIQREYDVKEAEREQMEVMNQGIEDENLEENEVEKEREDQNDVIQREYDIKEEEREKMEDMNQGIEDEKLEENEDEKEWEDQDAELQREYDIKEEERGQMEDVNQGIEDENLEENEDEKEREDQDDVIQREYDIEEEEREQTEDLNQGIEMRLGLNVAGDEHKQTQEVSSTNSSGVDEQGYEEDDDEYLEQDDDSLQEERNKEEVEIKDETEEIVKESTGLLEKIRDLGKIDDAMEHESAPNEVFEEGKDVEMTEPVTVKEIESQKLVKDGSKNEESVGEMHRVVILAEGNAENNFNSREIEELDLVARDVMGDTHKDKRNMESDEKLMKTNDGSDQDAILKTKKEHLIDSNKDAREISNESGLDLLDGKNTILEGGDKVEENNVMSLPGFRHAPLDSDNDKVISKTNRKTPSREDVLEDEKIWEKIGAMRAIVGYKAPSQPTCIGELKALYVFTGVEPPASFKDDSDRYEVNAKLKFLMSIVGVK